MAFIAVIFVFALAVAGVFVGTRLAEAPKISHGVLALSGAVLIAISLFWVVPEAASHHGWLVALMWMAAGFALLWVVDRYVYPICGSCSHTHNHSKCAAPLHGFAAPLLLAIGIHSFLDGWGVGMTAQGSEFVKVAFLLGIGLHKIPEGLALGAIARASIASHWRSVLACIIAESMTVAGGVAGIGISARPQSSWAGSVLAVAAGIFVYLGFHALESELHRRLAHR